MSKLSVGVAWKIVDNVMFLMKGACATVVNIFSIESKFVILYKLYMLEM